MPTTFYLNGAQISVDAPIGQSLLNALRHGFGRLEVKQGCETGHCGACTVLLDGNAVQACQITLGGAQGASISTASDLATDPCGSLLGRAFSEAAASQCGYCIPGIVVTLVAALRRGCSVDECMAALAPHRCRCGTHLRIRAAVELAHSQLASVARKQAHS